MFRFGNRSQSGAVARNIVLVAMMLLFASCNMATISGPATAPADVDVLDKVRSLDILPRGDQPVAAIQSRPETQRVTNRTYEGAVISDVAEIRPQPTSSGPGYDLNFENTPVATVAKVVLGDILGLGYTIDPRVQGSVSLISARPVPKSDIVFVLESALRLSGVVLVRDAGGYKLTPLGDAVGAGHVDAAAGRPEAGYGVSVVPLQYVGAQTILKLMDSFATRAGSVRADPTRNLLLIQGTGAERRTAVETALSFDVDWMRGQSVGIFPVNNSAPEPLIAELEKIMDSGENGLSQNLVKLQVVNRLNAIMVVTRKPALLQAAATWIRRLDQADSTRTSVHVYRIRYGDARQLAKVLTEMFVGSASASLDSAENQLAPGSGGTTTSVAERLSFNTNSSSASASPANRLQGAAGAGSTTPSGSTSSNGAASSGGLDTRSGGGQPLMPNVRITPDIVNNALLIYADRENYRTISSTLQQLDQPVLQVAIDATIAEVTLTNELSYGVQTYLTSKQLGLKANQGSILNTQSTSAPSTTTTTDATTGVVSTVTSAMINRAFPGFNFLIGSESQPAAILDALHEVTSVKVLSNPSLVVINNQTATLQVGDVVPVSTGSATVLSSSNTVVNTIDYRNTGIILRVVPRITANGNVRLEIEQEISNVSPQTSTSLTPTVSQRKVKSSVSVANSQTVLLAGLISEQQNGSRNGIPLLDEIPGLGDAFSHQGKKGTRTELIIFIRPQIIRDGSDAHQIAEELRSKLRGTVGASITDDLRVQTVR
ncbi:MULTISPECIES: type II secretion system secretin GspD [unclassified Bradyrhizobium]|uniref:type II secretion system secretin GspD n=1 Tax=unclassified Bradyrhizobium TaxID=2631580 RepID=UPI00247AD013|nr:MULTISPECIES: type II secretion system secretin GspD [unclassified Bradyrhizobium]WGR74540.1 type II secretion system secretin GspD [Bradyrhizobium sp. ISRA426]WGR79375.1 type II secretion system secretin GspD [Bradyrhizobium sp. ISRA430]WGR89712.1 type II secretion system secretin GspD [Bradyrhizobium sp. ISRA432]